MLKSYECTGRMNPVSAALWIGRMVSLSIVRFEGLWSPLIRCRAGILLVLLCLNVNGVVSSLSASILQSDMLFVKASSYGQRVSDDSSVRLCETCYVQTAKINH
ncbi:hypothetical protein X801_09845, partial [Opisthorchis viverrini]